MVTPENFWSRVDKSGECWIWTGGLMEFGYGRVCASFLGLQGQHMTHRVSWIMANGPIPDGLCVLHHCDNPPCVRPDHLFLGTRADNTADMVKKGRGKAGAREWGSRTHGTRNANAKMTEPRVIELRKRAAAGENFRELAQEFGISASNACAIIIGNAWRHVWPFNPDGTGGPKRTIHPRPTARRAK